MSIAITTQDTGSTVTSGQSSQSIITGNPSANSTAQIGCAQAQSVVHNVAGTWTGTLQFEATFDAGNSFVPVDAVVVGTGTIVKTITANGSFIANAAGAQSARLRATAAMTGSAQVNSLISAAGNVVTSIPAA